MQVFISVSTSVMLPMPLLKIDDSPALPARFAVAVQISGSFTRLKIHSVTNAGRMPVKNTARQP